MGWGCAGSRSKLALQTHLSVVVHWLPSTTSRIHFGQGRIPSTSLLTIRTLTLAAAPSLAAAPNITAAAAAVTVTTTTTIPNAG